VHVDHDALVRFLPLLALIIAAAKAGGWLSLRLGQPAVLGEIAAGVVLGPSLLNVLGWPAFEVEGLATVVGHLANLGVILLMFIAGLETDLGQMRRVGRVAAMAGTAGVFVPLVFGFGAALPFGYPVQQALFVGVVLTATSVSITVQTLIELGQLETKEGTTLLAAAVIDDVIAIIVLSVFVALSGTGGGAGSVALVGLRMALFFVLAILAGRVLAGRGLPRAARLPVSEGLLAAVAVGTLLLAWAAEALGQVASITGAYIAGVLVAGAGFREEIEHRLRAFTYAILVPVFFVGIGLQTNARLLAPRDLPFALLIIAAAVVGKIIGSGLGARAGGFTGRESLRIGVGMVSRGEVGLIIAGIGLQGGLLTDRGFAVMVIMVLATTLLTPILLRAVFPRRGPPLTQAEAVEDVMGERPGA
jgi:Kef-type K+ transport system membrane component KefB